MGVVLCALTAQARAAHPAVSVTHIVPHVAGWCSHTEYQKKDQQGWFDNNAGRL